MHNKPIELTVEELKEIASLNRLWELWGARNAEEMLEVLELSYCVKFHFVSGGPGYVGGLYIIQGDAITDAPPVSLTRDLDGKVQILEYIR